MKQLLLKIISLVLHPLLVPTYIMCLLLWSNYPYASYLPLSLKFLLLQYLVLGTIILPLIIASISYVKKNLSSVSTERKEEQLFPSASCIIFFTLLSILFYRTHFPVEIKLIPIISLVLAIFVFLINLKYNISAHVAAIAAATAFILCLTFRYNLYLLMPTLIAIIASGVVCYTRIEMKAHMSKEVYLSYLLGLFVSSTTYLITLW